MDRAPRFSSLFFRQRLNATVLPMLGGIALFLLLPQVWAALLLLLGGGVCIALIFRRDGEERKILLCVLAGLSLALAVMGVQGIRREKLEKLCGAEREAEGYVVEKTDGACDLALTRLDGKAFYKKVRLQEEHGWELGERRRVKLVLNTPDPKGARGEGVDALATCADSGSLIGKSAMYTAVGRIRESLSQRFAGLKNGGFLAAILLGDRRGLAEGQNEAFRRTASSHILAISGLHVSQTVMFLMAFLRLFPISRRVGRILLFPLVLLLYLLAGAGVSVFRASVMTLFSVTGLLLRRRSDSVTALCLSAGILVMGNPYAPESLSFLLSYASTFGVVYLGVPLCEYVRFRFTEKKMPFLLKKLQGLVLSFVISSVSFVFVAPMQLLLFDTATPLAPLYAVILVPLFQICLILSLVGALLSGIPFLPEAISAFCLRLPALFPDFVIFLAKGAPLPIRLGDASLAVALLFLFAMLVMYRKKASMASVFLLHGIWIAFLGIFSFYKMLCP